MFGFSYTEGGPWSDDGIKAIVKFYDRVERLAQKVCEMQVNKCDKLDRDEKELLFVRHNTIKCVSRDMEDFSFNTACARLMELLNALNKYDTIEGEKNEKLFKDTFIDLILLLAPCAPHFTEEVWQMLGNKKSIFTEDYPVAEEKWLVRDENEVAVQVNSKIKTKIVIPNDITEEEILKILYADDKVAPFIVDKQIKKLIVIPRRLINVIV